MLLAGDVGGTNTRIALFSREGNEADAIEIYESAAFEGLEPLLDTFLAAHPSGLEAATLGVAGPVRDGRTEAVNLAWPCDAGSLAEAIGIDHAAVSIINDLEANAWGIEALDDDDVLPLNEGEPDPSGNVALISAGTGLGESFITYGPGGPAASASEGGHIDFAPQSDLEGELRDWMAARLGHAHVSYELVCSGKGLVNVYGFLRERAGDAEPDWLIRKRAAGSEAAAISQAGMARRDPLASQALDLMISIYGAQAGNLALTVLATAGVYLGGGIPPKIASRIQEGGFLRAFVAKGRMRALMERIPVWLILNDRTALLGAARHAASTAAAASRVRTA
jgi:glucokinase